MSESPSGTTVENTDRRLLKPILIAGVLGGLFAGGVSFALSRFIKPVPPPPQPVANQEAINEAREAVTSLLAELKDEKTERFMAHLRPAYLQLTDDQFKEFKKRFVNDRLELPVIFGKPLGQFELLRESAIGPNLIHFIYMERYERNALIWRFTLYRGPESWNLASVKFDRIPNDALANY